MAARCRGEIFRARPRQTSRRSPALTSHRHPAFRMSLLEPILPSLRAGLSHSVRNVARPHISRAAAPLKRKFTPVACAYVYPHSHPLCLRRQQQQQQFSTSTARQNKDAKQTMESKQSAEEKEDNKDWITIPDPGRGERLADRLARAMQSFLPQSTREQYFAYRKAEDLWKECRIQGEYTPGEEITGRAKFWYEDCDIAPCLRNWAAISGLHVWLLMVRIRNISPRARAKLWQQHLINHFFFDMEDILTKRHKVEMRSRRQKALKELYGQFQYQILSYDEAFIRGDAYMAGAIWTTIFMLRKDMDFHKLAVIVSYMRRILSGLDQLDEQTVLDAQVWFGNPMNELEVVEKFSEKSTLGVITTSATSGGGIISSSSGKKEKEKEKVKS
ncbi:Protein cbp3, mitochondrial [Orbilia brochopaga]|uniref:Protein cbp3, mitochondrial n=1 Tax=Orbilia brochopaga TaxID=3140254 RepID=A0AAV9UJG5_9PEZI